MQKIRFGLVAGILGVALVGLAVAQPPGGGRGMMQQRGGFMYLASPDVQKELKLTDDQKEKLKKAGDEARSKMQEMRQSAKEGGFDKDKMMAMGTEMAEAAEKTIKEVLNADQQKRLKQITWQQEGAEALEHKEMLEALKLTEEQKDKIKGVNEEMIEDRRNIFREARENPEEMRTKLAALKQETMERVEKIMTADQKKTYISMLGPKFEGKIEMMGQGQGKGGRTKGKGGDKDKKDGDKKDSEKPKRGDGV